MADLFKGLAHANLYSQFRPSPPAPLIKQIISYAKSKISRPLQNAVDVGCGTGQSTLVLAPYFQQVTGIDISEAQVSQATENRVAPNVQYKVSGAEQLGFPDSSCDLVTACQSIHWCDIPQAFREFKRVLVPNGAVAIYGYSIPFPIHKSADKTKTLQDLIMSTYNDEVGKYWDKQRVMIENCYKDIELPFADVVRNDKIVLEFTSTVSDYIGYLSSWSAYQKLLKDKPDTAKDLLKHIQERFMEIFDASTSPEQTVMDINTDYFAVMGRKPATS